MNRAHTAIKIISRKYILTLGLCQNTSKTSTAPWMFPLIQLKKEKKKKSEKHIADFFFLCQYIALLNLF